MFQHLDTASRYSALKEWCARVGPGIVLSAAIALSAALLESVIARAIAIPATVIALILGAALNGVAQRVVFQPGMMFCVKIILRWAVALLGFKVVLGDILSLGLGTILLVVVSMIVTVLSGFLLSRLFGQAMGFGALIGAATAVCGASAALATSTVVPSYKGKDTDIAFTVVAANALATVGMLLFPIVCVWLGFNDQETGIFLGGTIHDVAQVAGAADAIPLAAGKAAIIVKLFRVFLLLPTVLVIGWWFTRMGAEGQAARVPVPMFALAFLLFCLMNSAIPAVAPVLAPAYETLRGIMTELSRWGLLLAIAALGLGTSVRTIIRLGWRHCAAMCGVSCVIVVVVAAGLFLMR